MSPPQIAPNRLDTPPPSDDDGNRQYVISRYLNSIPWNRDVVAFNGPSKKSQENIMWHSKNPEPIKPSDANAVGITFESGVAIYNDAPKPEDYIWDIIIEKEDRTLDSEVDMDVLDTPKKAGSSFDSTPAESNTPSGSSSPETSSSGYANSRVEIQLSYNPDRIKTMKHTLNGLTKTHKWCAVCWSVSCINRKKPVYGCQHSKLKKEKINYMVTGVCHRCGVPSPLCKVLKSKHETKDCKWPNIVAPVTIHAWSMPELKRSILQILGKKNSSLKESMTTQEWKKWLGTGPVKSPSYEKSWATGGAAVLDCIIMINETQCLKSPSPLIRGFFRHIEGYNVPLPFANDHSEPGTGPRIPQNVVYDPNRLEVMKSTLSNVVKNNWCGVCWSMRFLGGFHHTPSLGPICKRHGPISRQEAPHSFFDRTIVCCRCGTPSELCKTYQKTRKEGRCNWPAIVLPILLNAWRVPEIKKFLIEKLWRAWLKEPAQMACRWESKAMAALDMISVLNEGVDNEVEVFTA
ncbi:hypothetical protein FPQ18DRAFT_309625 [Pyronema domesticum]|nr:hypothetical protein FPQ18DRAFT_309625 [Pyronema domesticum]